MAGFSGLGTVESTAARCMEYGASVYTVDLDVYLV